jgi:integrase
VLITLGLLNYVAALKQQGEVLLFPEVSQDVRYRGDALSRFFSDTLRKRANIEAEKNRKVAHSFRHTLATKLHRAGVEHLTIEQITGHSSSGKSTTELVYIKRDDVAILREAIATVDWSFCLDQVHPFPISAALGKLGTWKQSKSA